MATSMFVKVTCLTVICLVLGISMTNAALSCPQVQLTVVPCLGYLRNPGPSVPAPCCNGLRGLNNQAKTTPERQSVCRCLKTTAQSLSGLNVPALATLPKKCGVNLPYKISTAIDCNTYVHLSLNQPSFLISYTLYILLRKFPHYFQNSL
ncbi:Lipid transfer protein [Medicago truncatula]|uniref:Non-specific lipid-transfer protein n=1 Tax=Medicago truncatula TaxID=3880 RepID=G7KX54_MEDTR|nr:Lipid transfer protein [Medicago truncatula]